MRSTSYIFYSASYPGTDLCFSKTFIRSLRENLSLLLRMFVKPSIADKYMSQEQ